MTGPVDAPASIPRPPRRVDDIMADPAMPGLAAAALCAEIDALGRRAATGVSKLGSDYLGLRAVRAALAARMGVASDAADRDALAAVPSLRARKALGLKASQILHRREREGAAMEPWTWLQIAVREVEAAGWPGARARRGRPVGRPGGSKRRAA